RGPDGRGELTGAAVCADGSPRSGEPFTFRRHHFSWEGNRLGITDEVFPPFEPIRVEGRTLDVVDRRYRLGPLGLPEQITSNGRDLLAAPIRTSAAGLPTTGYDAASASIGTIRTPTPRRTRARPPRTWPMTAASSRA
ncbi:MAG: hypothetical protein HQ581_19695, partial [Planctomycetes bacterium]|nr:hypothetical protein [Planctomycetota bacterium]